MKRTRESDEGEQQEQTPDEEQQRKWPRKGEQSDSTASTPDQSNSASTSTTSTDPATDDAWKYLNLVKQTFQNQKDKFAEFLVLMRDFRRKVLTTEQLVERIEKLYEGYDELKAGFNVFLPPENKIKFKASTTTATAPASSTNIATVSTSPSASSASADAAVDQDKKSMENATFDHAISYISRIKVRYKDRPNVYTEFLTGLSKYRERSISVEEVTKIVCELFKDSPDLLQEFSTYLPQEVRETHIRPALTAANATSANANAATNATSLAPADKKTRKPSKAKPIPSAPKPIKPASAASTSQKTRSSRKTPQKQQSIEDSSSPSKDVEAPSTALSLAEVQIEASRKVSEYFKSLYGKLLDSYGDPEVAGDCLEDIVRCVMYYNSELISKSQLLDLVAQELLDKEKNRPIFEEFQLFLDQIKLESLPLDDLLYNEQAEAIDKELETAIEQSTQTINLLQPFNDQIQKLGNGSETFAFPHETLTDAHRNAINRIYGENGKVILDALATPDKPKHVIPVLLSRLTQKHEELLKMKTEIVTDGNASSKTT